MVSRQRPAHVRFNESQTADVDEESSAAEGVESIGRHFGDATLSELRLAIQFIERLDTILENPVDSSMRSGDIDLQEATQLLRSIAGKHRDDPENSTDAASLVASGLEFRHMHTQSELLACFPVISDLRKGLVDPAAWVARTMDMKVEGYRVLAAHMHRRVVAMVGYRVAESLLHGRFVRVEDLVTTAEQRSKGIGAALLDELDAIGRDECCTRIIIDVPTASTSVHGFLRRSGLRKTAIEFIRSLETTT